MAAKDKEVASSSRSAAASGNKSDSARQSFQNAHDAYMKAVDEAWTAAQMQCQKSQLAYHEQVMRMHRAATPDELKQAQAGIQEMISAPQNPPSLGKELDEALMQYKTALIAALTGANPADLDPAMLAAIGQSLLIVAQLACQTMVLTPTSKTA